MPKLLTADVLNSRDTLAAPDALVARAWPHHLASFAPPEGFAPRTVAHAEVNHGRWIVRCPFSRENNYDPPCDGAQLASEAHKRFFCVDCLHGEERSARGRWLRVVWPEDATRREIERLLLERRYVENRSWKPSETPDDLRSENSAAASLQGALDRMPEPPQRPETAE